MIMYTNKPLGPYCWITDLLPLAPGFLLLMLTACSFTRHQKNTSEDLSWMKFSEGMMMSDSTAIRRQHLLERADSSLESEYVVISPRGAFSYSAQKGFKGEAKQLVIAGRSGKFNLQREITDSAHLTVTKQQHSQERAEKTISKTKQNNRVTRRILKFLPWVLLTLLLIVYLLPKYRRAS